MSIDNLLHANLKIRIMAKAAWPDSEVSYRTISEHIFNKTGNYLSEATITQYFEQSEEGLSFSPFVMNSFAQYIGYTDWETFLKSYAR